MSKNMVMLRTFSACVLQIIEVHVQVMNNINIMIFIAGDSIYRIFQIIVGKYPHNPALFFLCWKV